MSEKPDLIKLFGLEGQLEPKKLYDETSSDIDQKTPLQVTEDLHTLIDMLNLAVTATHNMPLAMKIMQGIILRTSYIQERLYDVQRIYDKYKPKDKDD